MSNTPNKKFVAGIWEQNKKTAHLQKTDPTFYFRFSKHPKKYTKNSLYIYLILIGVDNGMGPKPWNLFSAKNLLASSL